MTSTDQPNEHDNSWESIGRAAEDFARRVARDASKFAHRMEEHAGDFARDVSRDWRRARHHYRRHCGPMSAHHSEPDVRRIFEDIRTVVADVLDGVDELIERMFREPRESAQGDWVRVVSNRAAACAGCTRSIGAGEEAYIRRTESGNEIRCLTCGIPTEGTPAAG